MTVPKPSFVTLTGCDRSDVIDDLHALADAYQSKVEFGILIDPERFGTARFPSKDTINDLRRSALRLSAHICGGTADAIFAGHDVDIGLSGFSRAQINLVGRHARPDEVENAIRFGKSRGIRIILQCSDHYPADARCDWLLDTSFGAGRQVVHVPDFAKSRAFCGVSGGLSPSSVMDVLMTLPDMTQQFWIDAESSLFEDEVFSTSACHTFLKTVYS